MRDEPPGLPPRLMDQNEYQGPESRWDALARAIAADYINIGERERVVWYGWSLIHWCCFRPMRKAVVDTQKNSINFGWQRDWMSGRYLACRRCGRIKQPIL